MSTPPTLPPVAVHGGPGGLVANREALHHLATLFARADLAVAATLQETRLEQRRLATTPFDGYGRAGFLDPAGLARAGEVLDDALRQLDHGLEDVRLLAARLGSAADGYPWGTDALQLGVIDHVEGLLRGVTTLAGLPLRAVGISTPSDPGQVAGMDPRTVDLLVNVPDLPAISATLTGAGDGTGVALPTGRSPVPPPRGLGDVVGGLGEVDRTGGAGGIDVRVLTDARGRRRAVVDITGTRTWGPGGANPADVRTNAGALVGEAGAYSQGVLHALRQAGIRSDEPVMLVGHSQGGMVAVAAAERAVSSGEFAVTHVVTAGSPIALTVGHLPPSVRVLALENTHDVVPRLDGRPNPDRVNVTTVTGPVGHGGVGSVGDSHAVTGAYRPLAEAADGAGGRSMRDYLDSANGFFTADTAEQHCFRVERH